MELAVPWAAGIADVVFEIDAAAGIARASNAADPAEVVQARCPKHAEPSASFSKKRKVLTLRFAS